MPCLPQKLKVLRRGADVMEMFAKLVCDLVCLHPFFLHHVITAVLGIFMSPGEASGGWLGEVAGSKHPTRAVRPYSQIDLSGKSREASHQPHIALHCVGNCEAILTYAQAGLDAWCTLRVTEFFSLLPL